MSETELCSWNNCLQDHPHCYVTTNSRCARSGFGRLISMSRDDHALARLREAYPGWRIWHVPGNGQGTWCAQPLPLINVGSPDELMRAIEQASPGSSQTDSKGFDPEGDMPVRAKGS